MKDQTVVGAEPTKTPVAGVGWAGETEAGEVTLSDQATLVLERADASPQADFSRDFFDGGDPEVDREPSPGLMPRIPGNWAALWVLARSSLLGAIACGVLGGLLVALILILVVRLMQTDKSSLGEEAISSLLITTIRVQEPSGAPVPGARVRSGDRWAEVDAQGLVRFEEELGVAGGSAPRFRYELTCPPRMRATEGTREVIASTSDLRPSRRIERSLTFSCETTEVELRLLLRAEGGEAKFWLGEEDLGSTVGGRLEKTVLLEKRSERALRAEPIAPKGETRKPRVTPLVRTVTVQEEGTRVEHSVKIEWPRRRVRAREPSIPYRL